MKKAIGGVYIYNLIIIFLLIMFGFIMASLSYTKAFKVSKGVAAIVERFSGYNDKSKEEISKYLSSLGYQKRPMTKEECPEKKDEKAIDASDGICVYLIAEEGKYVTYGIISYMTIDLPVIELFRIPIYIETEKIYIFS